ncbi:hypothetical protein HY633_03540 [Candidatus Uhrbacteria bacterium]|nr:hypothetical protein [Candidatus Uhrbacteria bacterium]
MEAPPLSSVKPEAESTSDFGESIGELLGQAPSTEVAGRKSPSQQDDAEPAGDGERLPIERALRLAKGEEIEMQEEEPVRSLTTPKLMLAGLFVLVLVFSAAAVAGIIMFVRKNGVPDVAELASRISLFRQPEQVATPSPVVEPRQTANVVVVVSKEAAAAGDMPNIISRVLETDVKGSKSFDATGTAPAASAKSTGTIVIVNATSRAYTFVATTRFISKDGVLFRLKTATAIPANGKVRAAVAADKPGSQGDIGPSTFIIPGLSENLRDDIYGESDAAMSGGSGTVAAVSADDLAKARADMAAELATEAGKNLEAMLLDGEKVVKELVTSEDLAVAAPAEGAKTAAFTLTLSMRFRALVLPEPALRRALAERAKTAGGEAGAVEFGPLRLNVQAYDVAGQRAEVRVEADVIAK